MSFKNIVGGVVFSLGASLLTSQAYAIAVTDVSFQNSLGGTSNPSAATQGAKKPKKSVINALGGLYAGGAWSLLDRTNKPSKTFNGVDFALTADTKHRSGDWGLSWDSPELTPDMDFVLVLKGGKQWAAYLFEAGSIDSVSGSIAGLFDMPLINKKGKQAKLRRATIFGRIADNGNPPPGDGNPPPGDGNPPPGDGNPPPGDGNPPPGDGNPPPGDGNPPPGDGNPPPGDGNPDPDDGNPGPNDPNPTAIPLPSSLVLLTLGLALSGRQLRRRVVR